MSEEKGLPEVASNFLSDCKKCGAERYHKVLAHPTPKSAKLQCEACGSKKTYKLAASGAKKRKKADGGADKGNHKGQDTEMWEKLKTELGSERPAAYKMTAVFEIQTAIEHPTFGLGFVTEVAPQKIQVLFREASKYLVHNRPR